MTLAERRWLRWALGSRLFTAGAVVAAVMAVSVGARADFYDGNRLYADCTSPDSPDNGRAFIVWGM
jgi:hypothetical protein